MKVASAFCSSFIDPYPWQHQATSTVSRSKCSQGLVDVSRAWFDTALATTVHLI